jgi:Protein of unknown function (DUF1573)
MNIISGLRLRSIIQGSCLDLCALTISFPVMLPSFVTASDLEFNQSVKEIHPRIQDKSELVVFEFKNVSGQRVHIKELRTPDQYVVWSSDKKDYEPGETGKINADFNFQNCLGAQRRKISVITTIQGRSGFDENKIVITGTIPSLFVRSRQVIQWNLDDRSTEKSSQLYVNPVYKLKSIQLVDGDYDSRFKVSLEAGDGMITLKVKVLDEKVDRSKTFFVPYKILYALEDPVVSKEVTVFLAFLGEDDDK